MRSCTHGNGGYGCAWSECVLLDAADEDRVLRRTRFTCERGVRTKVQVEGPDGTVHGVVHYAYDCWPPEKGCPSAAPLEERPPPPPDPVQASRQDVLAFVKMLNLERPPEMRVVPWEQAGRVVGLRFYGARRTSSVHRLGLKNGDVLLSDAARHWRMPLQGSS